MGGTIACLYAGTHPERVSRLALVEGLGPPGIADAPRRAARWLEEVPEVGEGAGYASARWRRFSCDGAGIWRPESAGPRFEMPTRCCYRARQEVQGERPCGTT